MDLLLRRLKLGIAAAVVQSRRKLDSPFAQRICRLTESTRALALYMSLSCKSPFESPVGCARPCTRKPLRVQTSLLSLRRLPPKPHSRVHLCVHPFTCADPFVSFCSFTPWHSPTASSRPQTNHLFPATPRRCAQLVTRYRPLRPLRSEQVSIEGLRRMPCQHFLRCLH